MIMHKPAHKDCVNPPGQIVNKLPDLMTPASKIINRANVCTWEKPLSTQATLEEAYRRGWEDAISHYESEQKRIKNASGEI